MQRPFSRLFHEDALAGLSFPFALARHAAGLQAGFRSGSRSGVMRGRPDVRPPTLEDTS